MIGLDRQAEHLGAAPKHWRWTRLSRTVQFKNGVDYKSVETDEPGYPVYGSGGRFRWTNAWLHDGPSVLFGRKGTIDRPLYVEGKFWTVDTMFYTVPDESVIHPKFLYYWATRFPFAKYMSNTALPSMTQSDLGNEPLALPPLSEQQLIVDYLEYETAEIDAMISEQEQLLDLLAERSISMVENVVTRGLSEEQLKPTGLVWPFRIPNSWTLQRMSWVFESIGSGTTPGSQDSAAFDGDVPWVTTGELRERAVKDTERKVSKAAVAQYSALKLHPAGSLMIAMYGATIGRLGWLELDATVNQAVCVFSGYNAGPIKFAFYGLLAARRHIQTLASGGGQPNINQEKLRALRLPIPPVEVQKSIVAVLEKSQRTTEQMERDATALIRLAKERRAALISAAVTGQIDVTQKHKPVAEALEDEVGVRV